MSDLLPSPITGDVRRGLALGIWTLLVLIAALVFGRAFGGAMHRALPTAWLLGWTLAGSAASAWAGQLLQANDDSSRVPRGLFIGWSVACVFGGAWLPVATPFQVGLVIGVALLHGGLATVGHGLRTVGHRPSGLAIETDLAIETEQTRNLHSPLNQGADAHCAESPENDSPGCSDAVQWMVRRQVDDAEICEGHLRVQFAQGQREITVHIAFCPPLAGVPTVELEDLDGLGWELKPTAAYPYGLRLTVRRGVRNISAETGRVAYWASAPRSPHRAAA